MRRVPLPVRTTHNAEPGFTDAGAGKQGDIVADERAEHCRSRSDLTVPPDLNTRPDDGIRTDPGTCADRGARPDDGARSDPCIVMDSGFR